MVSIRNILTSIAALAAVLSFSTIAIAETSHDPCAYSRAAMLSLDQNAFDQDFKGGWRAVAQLDDCRLVAADLIRDYIETNKTSATILIFHEAQMRAMAGQTDEALDLFAETYRARGKPDRIGWNHYVDATIAFLKKDRDALARARSSLLEVSEPEDFNPVDIDGRAVDLIWPPNLNVVDGFVACFSKSYDEAYNECSGPLVRKPPSKPRVTEASN